VAGVSTASWGIPVHAYNADEDAFIAKLTPSDIVTTTTSIMETTTTTIDSTTTTTIPTTTTTMKKCPAAQIFGDGSPQLEQFRDLRDSSLARSAMGRKMIQIYYNNADVINETLERSSTLKNFARRMLEAMCR
jgi:hypothetical protein